MRNPDKSTELVAQIRSQLDDVGKRIEDLVALQDGLNRALMRLAGQLPDKLRSNGFARAIVESKLLETLVAAQGQPVSTQQLFESACMAAPTLKYTTFRSYLFRLKRKGLIAGAIGMHGFWQLPGHRS